VSEGGLEPRKARIFPDSALEYAGWGEIPDSGISCAHGSGRGTALVNQTPRLTADVGQPVLLSVELKGRGDHLLAALWLGGEYLAREESGVKVS
jgi:hypothetical protein